ncbi:MAG: LysE family translocator [Thioalkalispiraceae bacterium]|jgi:threonine/homoserine/homoserine lactone efflux protein
MLAALPSASVALVVTRSATLGMVNGFAVAAGIVIGDLFFIVLAILGLSVIAETLGNLFVVIKYLGAAYLLWLGLTLLTAKSKPLVTAEAIENKHSVITSFLAGFFLTLGDIKAIFFYASLLPIYVDLASLQAADMFIILLVTVVAVGGIKVIYALSATKLASLARRHQFENATRKTAGGFMLTAGSYLLFKA